MHLKFAELNWTIEAIIGALSTSMNLSSVRYILRCPTRSYRVGFASFLAAQVSLFVKLHLKILHLEYGRILKNFLKFYRDSM